VAGALIYLRVKAHQRLPADARVLQAVTNAPAQKEKKVAEKAGAGYRSISETIPSVSSLKC